LATTKSAVGVVPNHQRAGEEKLQLNQNYKKRRDGLSRQTTKGGWRRLSLTVQIHSRIIPPVKNHTKNSMLTFCCWETSPLAFCALQHWEQLTTLKKFVKPFCKNIQKLFNPMSSLYFPDHFSSHAADYLKYRPTYPIELAEYLSSLV